MSIYFQFASQLDKSARGQWREFPLVSRVDGLPLSAWEHVRHELEQRLQCVRDKVRYSASSYLSAMTRDMYKLSGCKWVADRRIKATDTLRPHTAIILFRRPPPRYFTRVIPTRYRGKEGEEEEQKECVEDARGAATKLAGENEEEQLASLFSMSTQVLDEQLACIQRAPSKVQRAAQHKAHPDDYEYDPRTRNPLPLKEYVCKGCGATGVHFRQDCPQGSGEDCAADGDEEGVKAVDKIFVPTGIPKTFLVSVQESEADASTMVTRDGLFVKDVRQSLIDRVRAIDAQQIDVVPSPLDVDSWVDGEEPRFACEDYLEQVVDVKQKAKELLVPSSKKIQFMCTHWLQGLCHKGVLCEYLHVYDTRFIPICKFFMEGKCLNDPCAFRHILPASKTNVTVCPDYVMGFCARGPSCPAPHLKRDAPCLADFTDTNTFHAMVASFDAFVQQHRKADVTAKKRYLRAPSVTEMLYARTKRKKMGGVK
jgi:hypothetical protein